MPTFIFEHITTTTRVLRVTEKDKQLAEIRASVGPIERILDKEHVELIGVTTDVATRNVTPEPATLPIDVLAENVKRDLYLVAPGTNRIVYIPKNWCDETRQDDEEDGICINCWYGNADVLAYRSRESKEWLATDACELVALKFLEQMREVTREEAVKLDPDLFTLLDAINSGEAV